MSSNRPPDAAGVVLAGGRSSRMGSSKAALEWHGTTLLQRTAALLRRAVAGPVVVVRAPGQELPVLPAGVEVVEDATEGQGPVQGIAGGLGAVAGRAETAFVCSTDLPFLHPAFVRRVLAELHPDLDIVLPVARGYPQPLAAGYRTALHVSAEELVAAGRLRPVHLCEAARVLRLDDAALLADPGLAAADPELDSLLNVNRPEEYATARARPAPTVGVAVSLYGADGATAAGGPWTAVHAATLGAAAEAAGVDLARPGLAVKLNGEDAEVVPLLPLVAGDRVEFVRR